MIEAGDGLKIFLAACLVGGVASNVFFARRYQGILRDGARRHAARKERTALAKRDLAANSAQLIWARHEADKVRTKALVRLDTALLSGDRELKELTEAMKAAAERRYRRSLEMTTPASILSRPIPSPDFVKAVSELGVCDEDASEEEIRMAHEAQLLSLRLVSKGAEEDAAYREEEKRMMELYKMAIAEIRARKQ